MRNTLHARSIMPYTPDRSAVIETKLQHMSDDISEIKDTLTGKYVTMEAFAPVRNLVYGLSGAILLSVFVALLTLVLHKP